MVTDYYNKKRNQDCVPRLYLYTQNDSEFIKYSQECGSPFYRYTVE